MERLIGAPIVPVKVEGELLVGHEPLSFWGGYDQHTGMITDNHHILHGKNAAGKVLALPFSRGSSTTTAVLLEAILAGNAPAAILTTGVDKFFALASVVAGEMYAKSIAVVALDEDVFSKLQSGWYIRINLNGSIDIL
ncbi:MAG: DUF126 domain-containing protein [Anaerolineaceae bacterium]|nr:DUF126 domain-containing protein [Anaerolineaceae bacterium]